MQCGMGDPALSGLPGRTLHFKLNWSALPVLLAGPTNVQHNTNKAAQTEPLAASAVPCLGHLQASC